MSLTTIAFVKIMSKKTRINIFQENTPQKFERVNCESDLTNLFICDTICGNILLFNTLL